MYLFWGPLQYRSPELRYLGSRSDFPCRLHFILFSCRHQIAVGMWADFSLKDLGEPFRMWYIYADFSKKQTKEQERLLKLYRRAKNRKKTHSIIKAWRHLVSVVFVSWVGRASAWRESVRQSLR